MFWQLLGSLLELCSEAVRSCLGARLEAVQKFSFYIKNKSAGSCSAVFLAAARELAGAVLWQPFLFRK